MRAEPTFAADSAADRRDDALVALADVGISARAIAALRVDDVRIFCGSATVRLVTDGGDRFVRIHDVFRFVALRGYVERDRQVRPSSPLFPGRSVTRAMSARQVQRLLAHLRAPNAEMERA